jgi:hypothetical protein
MKQRTALLVSAVLTAFVLVLVGAVVRQFSAPANVAQADAPATGAATGEAPVTWQAAPDAATPPSQSYPVSPEQAAQIALAAVPNAQLLRNPELVDYNGTVAYEVALDAGNMYVDANSGQLLNTLTVTGPSHEEEEHHHGRRSEFGSDDHRQQLFGQPGQQQSGYEHDD